MSSDRRVVVIVVSVVVVVVVVSEKSEARWYEEHTCRGDGDVGVDVSVNNGDGGQGGCEVVELMWTAGLCC